MKATIKWVDGVSFVAESESGHAVVIDGPLDAGGRNIGMRPMEMVLLGMGGCTAFDVVSILQKARQPISDCRVELSAERFETASGAWEETSHSLGSPVAVTDEWLERRIGQLRPGRWRLVEKRFAGDFARRRPEEAGRVLSRLRAAVGNAPAPSSENA